MVRHAVVPPATVTPPPPVHAVPTPVLPLHITLPHGPVSVGIVHLPPPDTAVWMGAWAAVILAGVTAALAYFTWRLWRSTGELVRGADDTARRELRAYVAVEQTIIRPFGADTIPTADIGIKNFGRTPAYKLSLSVALAFGPVDGSTLIDPPPGPSLGHLAPGAPFSAGIEAPARVSAGQFQALRSRTQTLFLHGVIRYVDAFGARRFTRFRTAVTPAMNTMTCSEGNETDDDALIDRQQQQQQQ